MIQVMELLPQLLEITPRVLIQEPMSKHTSFGIGGPADFFVTVRNRDELIRLLSLIQQYNIPFFTLGGGTNLVVRDGGIRGIIIKLGGEFTSIRVDDNIIHAGAGALLSKVVNIAAKNGLSGLEFAAGIPGTVGGAVVGNAGTQTGCIGDLINQVDVLSPNGKFEILSGNMVEFSYRNSNLRKYIVNNVELLLTKQDFLGIISVVNSILEKRQNAQPVGRGAGSIFKNPEGASAWKLIENAGLKGMRMGGAYISLMHANFILADKGTKAEDVLGLIKYVQERVKKDCGVELAAEVIVIGEN
ncbi:UDP-N-acetylmuramate dehydrogenase [Candidatus Desantisbacteria bacterium]|nr:UDP-N-acetylmuramate dehydrogenase [Candidatus Desantisbacteria bacterium]